MMGWGMGFNGWLFMVLPWIVAVGLLVWLAVTLFARSPERSKGTETALDILNRRFASGELDEDQYRRARSELAGRGAPENDTPSS
jgi:putative membrane protein